MWGEVPRALAVLFAAGVWLWILKDGVFKIGWGRFVRRAETPELFWVMWLAGAAFIAWLALMAFGVLPDDALQTNA
jgi:hypothetical protein